MAIVNSFGCCELFTAGVCIGVYTMIVYLGAFIMELWWIIENNVQLPVPAYVLAAGYFSIFLVSLFLLAGLFLRKSNYLLGWLFVSVLFFFPECGLALFMSLQYWKLDSKGIAELAFYIARAVMNVVCIVCIQSLYTQWKQEKAVMRRLQNLNVTSYRDLAPSKSNGSAGPSGSASNGVASGSASPGVHRANWQRRRRLPVLEVSVRDGRRQRAHVHRGPQLGPEAEHLVRVRAHGARRGRRGTPPAGRLQRRLQREPQRLRAGTVGRRLLRAQPGPVGRPESQVRVRRLLVRRPRCSRRWRRRTSQRLPQHVALHVGVEPRRTVDVEWFRRCRRRFACAAP
nr:uncharacterized protein LOC119170412 isoform X1 [Rhipicephalus microplus]